MGNGVSPEVKTLVEVWAEARLAVDNYKPRGIYANRTTVDLDAQVGGSAPTSHPC